MKKFFNFLIIVASFLSIVGCSMGPQGVYVDPQKIAQIGAGIGAGIGALVGQEVGHNRDATLIGAGIGAVAGYILGNEIEKYSVGPPTKVVPLGPGQQRVTYPLFDQAGRLQCEVVVDYKFYNNQWHITRATKNCRGRSYEPIPR